MLAVRDQHTATAQANTEYDKRTANGRRSTRLLLALRERRLSTKFCASTSNSQALPDQHCSNQLATFQCWKRSSWSTVAPRCPCDSSLVTFQCFRDHRRSLHLQGAVKPYTRDTRIAELASPGRVLQKISRFSVLPDSTPHLYTSGTCD